MHKINAFLVGCNFSCFVYKIRVVCSVFICCFYARQNKRVIHDLFKDIIRFSIINQQHKKMTFAGNVFVRNNFILRHAVLLFRPMTAPSFIIATCDSFKVIFFTLFIYLFNLYKNHNYMAAPQSDPVTLSAFEASKRLTIKFTK